MLAIYQAAKEQVDALLADGTYDCHYVFPQMGGFVIVNADTHEAAWEHIMASPCVGRLDWEVQPLCDWRHVYDKMIDRFQKRSS